MITSVQLTYTHTHSINKTYIYVEKNISYEIQLMESNFQQSSQSPHVAFVTIRCNIQHIQAIKWFIGCCYHSIGPLARVRSSGFTWSSLRCWDL